MFKKLIINVLLWCLFLCGCQNIPPTSSPSELSSSEFEIIENDITHTPFEQPLPTPIDITHTPFEQPLHTSNDITHTPFEQPPPTPNDITHTPFEQPLPTPDPSVHENFNVYPDDLAYVNNETFYIIKDIYDNIDFFGTFQNGDLSVYDYYKKKYTELLSEEKKCINTQTGEAFYLSELEEFRYPRYETEFNLKNYIYFFFDVDGDNRPELCISDVLRRFTYIFDYVTETDEFILWHELPNGSYQLHGTNKIAYNKLGFQHGLDLLDANGNIVETVTFFSVYQRKELYMLFLPEHVNENMETEIIGLTDEMKTQGFLLEGYNNIFAFKVTKEQYYEITKNYFIAIEEANIILEEIAYTYDELFNDLVLKTSAEK